jgi:nitrogen fixation/metabolism regulation signal transduction histidine kinase
MVGLKYKILLLTIIPLTIILLFIGSLTVYNKISTERELLLNRLESYRSLLESGDLAFETSADKVKLESLLNEKVEFSEIVNEKYEVIYSSENSAVLVLQEQDKKDIQDAFQGFKTIKNIGADEGRTATFVIVSPLVVNNKVVAVLHQGLSNEKSNQRILTYAIYIILLVLSGIGICFVLISILLNSVVLKNIYRLKQGAMEIQEGILDKKIEVKTNDEIGILANTFNSMREAIKIQKKQLQDYSKELEKKVKERTEELESKNKELEKFNRFTTDRELKMVELKKEIALLKKDSK